MEIRKRIMYQDELQTPPSPCSVCGETFQPSDDLDFVCIKCKHNLVGHCDCGSDDVVMEWGVDMETDLPYFWVIECLCGNEMRSRLHSLQDVDVVAKELHKEWCLRLPTLPAPDKGDSPAFQPLSTPEVLSAFGNESNPALCG